MTPREALEKVKPAKERFEEALWTTEGLDAWLANNAPDDMAAVVDALAVLEAELGRVGELEGSLGGQWISVEERLPEEGRLVLLFGGWMNPTGSREHVGFMEVNGTYWESDETTQVYGVTHWQPLPAPPEQEAGGGK